MRHSHALRDHEAITDIARQIAVAEAHGKVELSGSRLVMSSSSESPARAMQLRLEEEVLRSFAAARPGKSRGGGIDRAVHLAAVASAVLIFPIAAAAYILQ
jgi:hypothetical protein